MREKFRKPTPIDSSAWRLCHIMRAIRKEFRISQLGPDDGIRCRVLGGLGSTLLIALEPGTLQ